MSKKKQILQDERGNYYQLVNDIKEYVNVLPLVDPMFEEEETERTKQQIEFSEKARKNILKKLISTLLKNKY